MEDFNPTYEIDGVSIPFRPDCRDLGVMFSSDLSWNLHYKSISTKAYNTLALLRRIFSSNFPSTCRHNLHQFLVLPTLTYCSLVWRPFLIKDIIALKTIQHRATKYILMDYSSDYKSRLIKLNMLPLMYLYI